MKLYSLQCPNCSSRLEIEDDIDTFYCKYCGTKLVLQGRDTNALNTKVKFRQIDANKEIELQKIEYKKWKKEQDDKQSLIGMIVAIGFPIIIVVLFLLVEFIYGHL